MYYAEVALDFVSTSQILASPNSMVWELFQALRRLCVRIAQYPVENESEIRQDAAISIILAVQCVEVFLNIYFRVLVSEAAYAHTAEKLISDLQNPRFGLDNKLKDWPELVLGKKLNLSEGAGQRFIALKIMRNKLMHFTSSHKTIEIPGISIHGMADVSTYHSLSVQSALDALYTSEDFLCEVFTLRGIPPENLPHALHSWTGRVPA